MCLKCCRDSGPPPGGTSDLSDLTTHSFFAAAFLGRTGFLPLLCCSGRPTLTNDICSQTHTESRELEWSVKKKHTFRITFTSHSL